MRDYIAWYLVELRQRLSRVEQQTKVEDFLLETRAHLEDSIKEMSARGVPEESATRSAVVDFGEPALVAQAFLGKQRTAPIAYWSLVGIASLLALMAVYGVVLNATDSNLGPYGYARFDYGSLWGAVLAAVFFVALWSRKWCVLPVSAAALVFTAAAGILEMNRTEPYAFNPQTGQFLQLSESRARHEIEMRQIWIVQYGEIVAPLRAALADSTPKGDAEIARLVSAPGRYDTANQTTEYDYPSSRQARTSSTPYVFPPQFPGPDSNPYYYRTEAWLATGESRTQSRSLMSTEDRSAAIKAWRKDGEAYLASLESVFTRAKYDQGVFATPSRVLPSIVATRLVYVPLAIVFGFSLLALAVNAIAIGLAGAWGYQRRRAWRRRLT